MSATQSSTLRTLESMTMSDAHLWRDVLGGNADAFASVFDRHSERCHRHAFRLTQNRHDAEDITAAAFLELWRKRQSVRLVNDSVLPWLLATTSNVALNDRRARRRYAAFIDRIPRASSSTPDLESVALLNLQLSADPMLLAQIRSLAPPDRVLLCLVALEGYSLLDAAAAMNLTEHAARSRWQRVRRRLASSTDTQKPPHPATTSLQGDMS